jgi:uncharacterized protein (TIGR02147 family)
LVEIAKRRRPTTSLASLCKRAGISSKGYLSDALAGRHRLALRHGDGLAEALHLEGHARRLFLLLLRRDHAKEDAGREALTADIARARRVLSSSFRIIRDDVADLFFALQVFCAFGLFGNAPEREALEDYFGADRAADVERALARLREMGLVKAGSERLELVQDRVFFTGSQDGVSHVDFLRMAMRDASERVEPWFDRRDVSHFESSVVSVERSRYVELLAKAKDDLLQLQSDLESGDADMLVHFNVQIYPAGAVPSEGGEGAGTRL